MQDFMAESSDNEEQLEDLRSGLDENPLGYWDMYETCDCEGEFGLDDDGEVRHYCDRDDTVSCSPTPIYAKPYFCIR